MNKISQITRRDIFDAIVLEKIGWSGRLEEPNFLARIFDLSSMASNDSRFQNAHGDIWQHRINNYDWEDDWVFTDPRFDLLDCDDTTFLQFLCEMIHPIVRTKATETSKLLQLFNTHLPRDGFEIVEKMKISGKPIFVGRQILKINVPISQRQKEITNALSADYVVKKINLMEGSIENNPDLAIGTSKELIETICKTILLERGQKADKHWNLSKLLKETANELKLSPKDIPGKNKLLALLKKFSAAYLWLCKALVN